MTNWQLFKVIGGENCCSQEQSGYHTNIVNYYRLYLERHVEYSNGYYKHIDICLEQSPFGSQPCGS